MPLPDERRCIGCGDTEETARLERCIVCGQWYCTDCAFKTMGRRFCGQRCSVQFYYGEMDDDEDDSAAVD